MSSRSESLRWLFGGGEMGDRIRSFDWSNTPLGAPERWPQSLRSTVSMLLPSKAQIVVFWGPAFVVLYNDAYRPVFGAKHPDALGRPGREAWSEIWEGQLRALLEGVVRTGEAFWARDLLFVLERYGFVEDTYFDVSYDPVRDESGEVGGVYCIVTETTERIVGERRLALLRDLAARNATARTEREACVLAMDTLAGRPDVVFALAYFGDELLAATPNAEERLAAASPDSVKTISLPAATGGRADRLILGINPRRPFDEGYRAFLDLVADQVATALTNARAYETERRRVEALAEIDRAKTAFFSNVSHEFRTPLTLMLGPLADVVADPGLDPRLREPLEIAERNSLRLLKLVNTLLDFSRIEAGRAQASYEPSDLAALTADLASVFRSAIEGAGLSFVVDCPPLPEAVYVDREMWEKIVLNLLSNAFKFTFHGEIDVRLRPQEKHVELSVRDTGVGIPTAELSNVFTRFHRVPGTRSRSHEGTGIGLALVQELVRLHGGRIEALSMEGVGTEFVVTIPLGAAHLPPDQIRAPRAPSATAANPAPFLEEALRWLPTEDARAWERDGAPPAPAAAAAPRGRVVWADDNADMRDYVSRLLSPRYDVEAVGDGAAALSAVSRETPDVVLVDVMMPALDGIRVLRALKSEAATAEIPVILISARAGEESRIEGMEAGADDYLIKPFSARELLARVDAHVRAARLRRESLTRIRDSETALRLSQARLVDADRRKDEFLAMLAHELRNPLAPLQTGLELIRVTGSTPESVERVRVMMERQIGHMVRLIDDLMDVSRFTSGKIQLQRQPTALAELVNRAVEANRAAFEAAGIRLAVSIPAEPCVLDVDRTRMAQVLSNLLHNALKFTPPGGRVEIAATCTAPAGESEGRLSLTLSDDGAGISKEILPRIFDLFIQGTDPQGRTQAGLGIGLALARRLVEMHGGRIEARSEGPGRGSTFTIDLPIPRGLAQTDAPRKNSPPQVSRRVVIVDDNEDAARSMAMLIEELGSDARVAHDGFTGVKAVAEFRPDIVLLDIGMPGMDGYETCRRMRAESRGRDILIVALTGWGQDQDKKRALDAGFDAHLTKPADPAVLERIMAGPDAAKASLRER